MKAFILFLLIPVICSGLVNPYRFGAEEPPGETYLLDDYGTDVYSAYSLRKLYSAVDDVIDAKRISDSDLRTFTGTEMLDGSTVGTYAGSSDVEVLSWIDQSGNGYHLDETRVSFPSIAIAGTQFENNGEPAIRMLASATESLKDSGYTTGLSQDGVTILFVGEYKNVGSYGAIWGLGHISTGHRLLSLSPPRPDGGNYLGTTPISELKPMVCAAVLYDSGGGDYVYDWWVNGVKVVTAGTANDTFSTATDLFLSARGNGTTEHTDFYPHEFIIWEADMSTDLPDIMADCISAWSVPKGRYDFESGSEGVQVTGGIQPTDGNYDEPTPSDFGDLNLTVTNGEMAWKTGTTGSGGTGPLTGAYSNDYYIYAEASGNTVASERWYIQLPDTFDGSTGLTIDYAYSMVSSESGTPEIQWQYLASGSDSTTGWVDTGTAITTKTTDWDTDSISTGNIGSGAKLRVYLQCRDSSTNTYRNDWALDDITITEL